MVKALLRLRHGVLDRKECAPMRIGSFVSKAALAEYFVIASMKDRLGCLKTQSTEHAGRFDHVEALLMQILARLPEKP